MTKLEFTLRELGELYEFAKAIRPYRIPREAKKNVEVEKIPTTSNASNQKPEVK